MRAGPRMVGSVLLSATAHGLLLGGLTLAGRFAWPAAPIPIEMVMPKPRVVPASTPEPPRPPAAAKAPRIAAINKEGMAVKKSAKPAPEPPPTTDLKPFAPDDANLVVVLRSDKLRASPHRRNVELLLSALPDYNTLLGGTGLSPIQDLEALLIATNDPRSVVATFLAARYHDSPRLRAVLARPLMSGDPRVFRTLQPGLTVLTRPEGAAKLTEAAAKLAEGARLNRPLAGEAKAGDDQRVQWLKQLEQFDRQEGAAFQLTVSDVPALMQFGGGIPTPLAMALAMTADGSPSLRLKLVFASGEQAAQLVAAWPEIVKRWRSATVFLGLATALDGLTISQKDAEAEVVGRLPETQLQLGLSWAVSLMPHPPDAGAN